MDGDAEHAGYRYGGMWKNKHVGASAKMPRKVKEREKLRRRGGDTGEKGGGVGGEGEGEVIEKEDEERGRGRGAGREGGVDDR